ncbi:hypothetical protein ACFSO7_21930 [Bacillus sp. CGMCC 1.16607]|uniref:hypothetical protein n=1 Tax=Bacillus sp. CGMCC 1.16607 TaxID=3351842 RepID=UPI00363D3FF4
MNFDYKDEILNLTAFQPVLDEIKQIDSSMGENIESAIIASLTESHGLIREATTIEQLNLGLIKEQILTQAQSSQYLNITDEITQKKNRLLESKPKIYHEFMQEVEQNVSKLLMDKKYKMFKEIEKDGSWYSGLRDTAKKSSGILVNATIKGINTVSKEINGKQVFENEKVMNSNTLVEELLEKYLNSSKVSNQMSEIITNATSNLEKKWIEIITANLPNVKRLSAFSIADSAKSHLKVDFQFGATEQVLAMGIGSAVIGTVGLAMGWHTMTYAMLNVFPPVALFAAVATVVVGVLTKDKAIEKRKMDIAAAVNEYHHYFLIQLYTFKQQSLENKSISLYMEQLGQKIVEETVCQWEANYFGKLRIEHFREINQAFVKHLMYVNEAIEEIENVDK